MNKQAYKEMQIPVDSTRLEQQPTSISLYRVLGKNGRVVTFWEDFDGLLNVGQQNIRRET